MKRTVEIYRYSSFNPAHYFMPLNIAKYRYLHKRGIDYHGIKYIYHLDVDMMKGV